MPGSGASAIRKKKEEEKGVIVRDLVMISQANADAAGGAEGLICCTDGGSFWYIDWQRESVDEVYYCHAGSPVTDKDTGKVVTAFGGVHCVAPHPFRNAVFASVGEDKILGVWDTSTLGRRNIGRLDHMAHVSKTSARFPFIMACCSYPLLPTAVRGLSPALSFSLSLSLSLSLSHTH